jgi:hypothetical protein
MEQGYEIFSSHGNPCSNTFPRIGRRVGRILRPRRWRDCFRLLPRSWMWTGVEFPGCRVACRHDLAGILRKAKAICGRAVRHYPPVDGNISCSSEIREGFRVRMRITRVRASDKYISQPVSTLTLADSGRQSDHHLAVVSVTVWGSSPAEMSCGL